MTRDYTHDDVCRGAVDGCDHDQVRCDGCERMVHWSEMAGEPLRCEECREEFEQGDAA